MPAAEQQRDREERREDEGQRRGKARLDEDEHRREQQRHLQRRVDDDRDREVRLVARGELHADDVLDGVPGDRDDDEAGEVLAHVQRVRRRL